MNTFFDIHMHAMNLNHPNLLAFLKRLKGLAPKLFLGGIFEPFMKEEEKRLLNLLTVMENSIEDYFLLLEYFLKHKQNVVRVNNTFQVGDITYDKMVLTPLIMDFGYKNIKSDTFYDIPPQKPVVEQTRDILAAIKKYKECELVPSTTKPVAFKPRESGMLFEIYPFLGINPLNYDSADDVTAILKRYFDKYTGRRSDLLQNMGTYDHSVDGLGNQFAGIKLYPPLGFDPYPEKSTEKDKVVALYRFCADHDIPITIHCSDGGFAVDGHAEDFTNPDKWYLVLKDFPKLRINLAHFGKQGKALFFFQKHDWENKVIELILKYDNVYTDFSCRGFDDDYYKSLEKLISRQSLDREKIIPRILFGSDFMINLLWSDSYNQYLNTFITTPFVKDWKHRFCSENPERFLFKESSQPVPQG
jgi:hypothetical protein